MTADQATTEAQNDVTRIKNGQSSGDKVQALNEEISSARDTFTNPADYNAYMQTISGAFKNDSTTLAAIDIYDRGSNEQELMQALGRNNDKLYQVLDTYADKHGNGQLSGDGSEADGDIGQQDLDAFLSDYRNKTGVANEVINANPELLSILENQQAKGSEKGGETFSRDTLLESLGYASNDADGFNRDHPTFDQRTAVFMGENRRPETIVEPNGVSTGISYDSNGNINGLNYTEPGENGSLVSHKLTRNAQGVMVDENGQPGKMQAPYMDKNGDYGFYTVNAADPNKYTKNTIDTATGELSQQEVDLNDPTVAIAGLNRPYNVNASNDDTFKVGDLEVRAGGLNEGQTVHDPGLNAKGQAVYRINEGDNLTNIVRKALALPADYDGPDLQQAMNALAKANGYNDPNQIPANADLVIPPDWNTRPLVSPPPPPAPVA
jgi:hypothetical protein